MAPVYHRSHKRNRPPRRNPLRLRRPAGGAPRRGPGPRRAAHAESAGEGVSGRAGDDYNGWRRERITRQRCFARLSAVSVPVRIRCSAGNDYSGWRKQRITRQRCFAGLSALSAPVRIRCSVASPPPRPASRSSRRVCWRRRFGESGMRNDECGIGGGDVPHSAFIIPHSAFRRYNATSNCAH
jgi:hypothetical protein